MNEVEEIASRLSKRVLTEKALRDKRHKKGNFVETALIESLYRYWLEDVLGDLGFVRVGREVPYPGQEKKRGGKLACDLVVKLRRSKFWVEVKVAYENTKYPRKALARDFDRLSTLNTSLKKMYITAFVSKGTEKPEKLKYIIDKANENGAKSYEAVSPIDVPNTSEWEQWEQPQLFINVFQW